MSAFKWKLTLLAVCLFASAKSPAIVGFYNVGIFAGDNLVAAQLDNSPNNTLDTVLTTGVSTGSTFSEWNPVANSLLPLSTYNGTSWSIDYSFGPDGIGGVLNSPSATTVTFVGSLINLAVFGTNEVYTFTPPARGPGTYLLGLAAPMGGATFQQIVGRAPNIGDSVSSLDGATQIYTTTTFNGSVWNNGIPSLAVGQADYFTLVAAPEPTVLALAGLGTASLLIFRRRNSKN